MTREQMTSVADKFPKRHERYLVIRDGLCFTATPCYGMHDPWWVVRTMADNYPNEAEPVAMRPTDHWCSLQTAVAKFMPAETPAAPPVDARDAFRAGFLATVDRKSGGWTFDGPSAADREPEAWGAWERAGFPKAEAAPIPPSAAPPVCEWRQDARGDLQPSCTDWKWRGTLTLQTCPQCGRPVHVIPFTPEGERA